MEVWNNQVLVEGGSWSDVNATADSVRQILVRRLVREQAVPAFDGITYWMAVPRSLASAAIYYVQSAPELAMTARTADFSRVRSIMAAEWSRWSNAKTGSWLALLVGQIRGLGRSFRWPAREIADHHIADLKQQQKEAAEQIARLLLARADGGGLLVNAMIEAEGHANRDVHTPADAMAALQAMLNAKQKKTRLIPGAVTRWWPAVLLSVLALYKLQGSWTDVVNWLRTSVWSTMFSFWQNWVVEPLFQIYLVIRHNPDSQMSLLAKDSLPSDRNSLERMVLSFAHDVNKKLSNAELQKIGVDALNGNMDVVMSVYEKQIGSPLLNLVAGDLVRAMLIQLQKSKVDAEVAISGIDQLIQSQQLVFGLVAAVPALGVVWWFASLVMSSLGKVVYGGRRVPKRKVFQHLQWLDLVVQSAKSEELSLEEVGLIYVGISLVRHAVPNQQTTVTQQLWLSLDRIEKHAIARDARAVAMDMDRLYSRYMAVV